MVSLLLVLAVLLCSIPVTFAATSPYVESDTTTDFTKQQGDYYWFKFTVKGTHADPKIAAGNGSVLKTGNCVKLKNVNGEDEYRFQVWTIGKPGEASAIYTTLPGQIPTRHCAITVAGAPQPSITSQPPVASQPPAISVETDPVKKLQNKLNEKYGTLKTNFGTYNLNITVTENTSENSPYDYLIRARLPLYEMDDVDEHIRYTDSEKADYFKAFKDQMAKIALAAENAFPDTKIYGGYYYSYYKYPHLQMDLQEYQLYTFLNFDGIDSVDLYLTFYEETSVDRLHWYPEEDYMEIEYEDAENYDEDIIE